MSSLKARIQSVQTIKGGFMPKGKVRWFDQDKGYGFIEKEEGGDIFVHHSEVQGGMLQEGQEVEYEVGEGRKGPCAVNVRAS